MREAILQVIGGLSDDLRVLGAEHFDCDQFVRQLADDASTTSSPFLRGRAIWCASQFARDCAPENSTHFLRAAIGSLQKYVIVLLSKSFNSLSLSLSLLIVQLCNISNIKQDVKQITQQQQQQHSMYLSRAMSTIGSLPNRQNASAFAFASRSWRV
jgi:hypothetical protein